MPSDNPTGTYRRRFTVPAARAGRDLVPRKETVLIIDHAQHGLGTASCGPGVLPRYVLEPKEFRFSVGFRGLMP